MDSKHKPARQDSRSEATRQAIVEAAESLFAQEGIDAVSLRRIGAQIGAGNTAVVAYHFGDKASLITAILHHRLPEFEARRAQLLAGLDADTADLLAVLRALWLPVFEQRDARGKHSYAAFLASLGRSQWGWLWSGAEPIVPVTLQLGRMLEARVPEAARPLFSERTMACTALITTMLDTLDRDEGVSARREQALFEDALRMAAAALAAPGE
ncbi:TetR/AcrR family transcriptional regulator [Mangrovimicrobium sediminis]|uniref:TetR/AcrR family transcriptional regulator n=1 Tax=Mangrovimicrobium sediminis TaxID=2562682 RepID=A0A4Z0M0H1_9GAMM|nr:TetR/AcrR family transcriptional regulator [Haliea sp. SAOS-164]TGD73019.1 TetR/AcrR family transcriptional regulator [Haliea sp. SAOS-164]